MTDIFVTIAVILDALFLAYMFIIKTPSVIAIALALVAVTILYHYLHETEDEEAEIAVQ